MADELKQLSTHSAKTLSEMQTGITLASTSGSQKAVVKDIYITNSKNRPVQIRLGSTTGQQIATGSTTCNLNGNEILDNSQSIVACTDAELLITNFVQRGWGDGNDNTPAEERTYNGTYQIIQHTINDTPIFKPQVWDGSFGTVANNGASYVSNYKNLPQSNGSHEVRNPATTFFDASGNMFAHQTADQLDYRLNGSADKNVVYKLSNNSSNSPSTNTTRIGSANDHDAVAWDGSRYFYTFRHDANHLRKYDTQTMGTSDTYTQIPVYDCVTSDTTAFQFYCNHGASGIYYLDGLLAWTGRAGTTNVGSRFSITDIASGRTKQLYDPERAEYQGVSGYNADRIRRSFGIAKDSAGDYWAVICNYKTENNTQSKNYWACTNMGSDPKTTFIPHAQSAKQEILIDMYETGTTNHQMCRRLASFDGRYFGNPRGSCVWSPSVTGGLYFYSGRYNQSTTNASDSFYYFNLDAIPDLNYSAMVTRYNSSTAYTGAMELVADATVGSAAWGTVSATTKGILTT